MLYDTTNLVRLVQHNEGSLEKSLALALGRVSVIARASHGWSWGYEAGDEDKTQKSEMLCQD